MTTAATMTTLSLEPLLTPLHVSSSAKEPEAPQVEAGGGGDPGPASLAYRLQRLWQERGDFNKLTAEALQHEEEEDVEIEDDAAGSETGRVRADTRHAREEQDAGDEQEDNEVGAAKDGTAPMPQHMSPDELWELKSTILQGLG